MIHKHSADPLNRRRVSSGYRNLWSNRDLDTYQDAVTGQENSREESQGTKALGRSENGCTGIDLPRGNLAAAITLRPRESETKAPENEWSAVHMVGEIQSNRQSR